MRELLLFLHRFQVVEESSEFLYLNKVKEEGSVKHEDTKYHHVEIERLCVAHVVSYVHLGEVCHGVNREIETYQEDDIRAE